MKRFAGFILVALLTISLVGCGVKAKPLYEQAPSGSGASDSKITDTPKGITVNKINFTEIKQENASEEVKQLIEENKINRGYHFLMDGSGEITLIVFAGEKKSGGFDIKVQSIEDNEGKAVVVVKETAPAKDAFVTMQITYPSTIIKFKGTTTNFVVSDTEGKEFKPVKTSNLEPQSPQGTAAEKKIAIRGKITKLTQADNGDGFNLFVEGKQEDDTWYDKASVRINPNTKVYKGNEALSVKDLKEGMTIEIKYDGPVLESYPVQMGADIITIIQ